MSTFREKLRQNGYDHEEAYFYQREQELIQKTREKNGRSREHLKLIQGGAQDAPKLLPAGLVNKKAA